MTQSQNPNDPAFPFACQGPTTAPEIYYGITMRDYFAVKALRSDWYNAKEPFSPDWRYQIALDAYKMADAMLKARDMV